MDLQTRAGKVLAPQDADFPMVIGWDLAGTIEQIGDQVRGWEIGDRVAAMSFQPVDQNGTYVELINLDADLVARVPDHLPLDHAATVPLAALTASQLVRWVDLLARGSLLINGPSGAVGGFAVQLASQAGIEVIAVAKPEDANDVLALGASEVVDRGEFSHAVHELHPGGVDAAIDVVGRAGTHSAFASVRDEGPPSPPSTTTTTPQARCAPSVASGSRPTSFTPTPPISPTSSSRHSRS